MNQTIISLVLLAVFIFFSNQAVAAGPSNSGSKRPHPVLRHASNDNRNTVTARPQTAPARGAAIGAAAQAAAGGASNPLLEKKKHPTQ